MTDNIVERLRDRSMLYKWPELACEAAAEIEQLRAVQFRSEKAEIAELRAANETMYIEIERLRTENEELKAELRERE